MRVLLCVCVFVCGRCLEVMINVNVLRLRV